ncbi:Wzy polymerase domain-containing protein [Serratia ureilytica]|uniref:Wzy polymerase domain-containing protein n=1 Tax=Serratia ureilytica TaxID=300181 RepID=UPI003D71432C
MLIHTQLEYPFYLSAPHWLAFLLLLALLDGQTGEPRALPFAKALSLPVASAAQTDRKGIPAECVSASAAAPGTGRRAHRSAVLDPVARRFSAAVRRRQGR